MISQFLYVSSFNLCLHTQSLCIHIFAAPILSSPTTCILMEPSLSSFLPLIHWHSYVSFTLSSKPYSCWLLLPNTRSTLPTTSPCSHLSLFFFFLCSLSLTTDGFARFLDSADFLPLSPCPTLQLPYCFLREDISNSRSHTRKLSFLLITSDSSLHSSICFHFSLQRSTPPSKDRR